MNSNFAARAASAIRPYNPNLVGQFVLIIEFLQANPDFAQPARNTTVFSDEYLAKYASRFSASRALQAPSEPATIPDEMVKFVLEKYWDFHPDQAIIASDYHNKAMGAENIIGNLLERYIAEALEPLGWVWCSGSVTKSIDFICKRTDDQWIALQIKNRDNSENSSSKKVREGTDVIHWFRTFSRRMGDNWAAFPEASKHNLSENGFRSFVASYLAAVKIDQSGV